MIRKPLPKKRDRPRRNDGRIQQNRMKPKAKVRATGAEARHMVRIAAMPCAVTGTRPIHVHHILRMEGKSRRRDHRYIVPLAPHLHLASYKGSVHDLGGEPQFLEYHGIDLVAWAVRAWEQSCKIEEGIE